MKTDREICDAAQEHWVETGYGSTYHIYFTIQATNADKSDGIGHAELTMSQNQFITHFNPAKIASMLDEIEELRGE